MADNARIAEPPDERGVGGGGSARLDDASPGRIIAVAAIIILFAEAMVLQYAMVLPAVQKIGGTWPEVGSNLSWMVIIVGVVAGATLPIVSKLADLHGKRRVLLLCSSTFLAGSLLCAVTDSWTLFLVGRALQSTAGAMIAIGVGLVRDLLPRRHIPVAIGALAAGFGLSGVVSPFVGGALTDHYSWRALFWFLVVYSVVITILMVLFVPESNVRVREKLDWQGALLVGAGVALALVYLSNGQAWGWGRPSAWGYLAAGLALLVAFAVWEAKSPSPMMDPRLLRSAKVSLVLGAYFFGNMVIGGVGYAVPYMAQTDAAAIKDQVLQGAAAAAGQPVEVMQQAITFEGDLGYAFGFGLLAFAVHITIGMSATSMTAGPLAGAWGRTRGLRSPLIAGMSVMTAACAMLALWHGSWFTVLLVYAVYGLGFGAFYSASNNLIVEAVPESQSSIGAGMLNVAGNFGAAVGTAMITAILSAHPLQMVSPSPTGQGTATTDIPQVYTDTGWTLSLWALGIAGLIGIVVTVLLKSGRAPATGGEAPDAAVGSRELDATPA
ncbi:MFS transporter [Yinghuangia soli]|uniref:MFS transporter n=1 Tax=Yinghuangia soli TaxID=2908204 RepID=A0AA41U2V2_9ACTN|nr:MFS transporter [Yinghuangia soli]MCF2531090.1 MFS transporter [Yinghuangia soli]